jgi:predicted DsbA family dithiol-disulfide isomerase
MLVFNRLMKITYFVEIFSSWCHWAEPAWAQLKLAYAGRVDFDWKIALMNPGDFPANRAQCDWFYRRSGTVMHSPYMLNSAWLEPQRNGHFEAANWVAEAGRSLGVTDDRLRLALAEAALLNGQTLGDLTRAADVGAKATGLDPAALRNAAESPAVQARVAETTAEFHSLRLSQRPAFVLENRIGDRAVFSGLVAYTPLAATLDAMLADAAAYHSYETHFGKVS